MDAELYPAIRRIENSHWWFRARRRLLLGLLERYLPPGSRLLDVGCGTGFFLEAAGRWERFGVDPSEQAVAYCRERGLDGVRQAGVEALAALDLPPADAVTFFDVLEHLDDDRAALRAARVRLRPGGWVFATVPAYQWLWSRHDVHHHHRRRYTAGRLAAAFADAGLEPVHVGYFNARLFPVAVGVRAMQRLTGRDHGTDHDLPSPVLNRFLERTFEGEGRRLHRTPTRTYPFGLSVLGVARRPE